MPRTVSPTRTLGAVFSSLALLAAASAAPRQTDLDPIAAAVVRGDAEAVVALLGGAPSILRDANATHAGARRVGELLERAVAYNDLELVAALVGGGADVNQHIGMMRTPIFAVKSTEMVAWLVGRGADASKLNARQESVFEYRHAWSWTRSPAVAEALLAAGTPLDFQTAVALRRDDDIERLRPAGLEPDEATQLLHDAINVGDRRLAVEALRVGADPAADWEPSFKRFVHRSHALTYALWRGRGDIALAILESGHSFDRMHREPGWESLTRGASALDVDAWRIEGDYLDRAIDLGHLGLMSALIDAGFDPRTHPLSATLWPDYEVPRIERALWLGDLEAARLLLDAGAEITVPDAPSRSAIVAACSEREEVLEFVIDRGAPLSIHAVARAGDMERLREFLARTDPDAVDPIFELPPLVFAIEGGHLAAVDALLRAGATVPTHLVAPQRAGFDDELERSVIPLPRVWDDWWRDDHEWTPLYLAVRQERWDIAEMLIRAGAGYDRSSLAGLLSARDTEATALLMRAFESWRGSLPRDWAVVPLACLQHLYRDVPTIERRRRAWMILGERPALVDANGRSATDSWRPDSDHLIGFWLTWCGAPVGDDVIERLEAAAEPTLTRRERLGRQSDLRTLLDSERAQRAFDAIRRGNVAAVRRLVATADDGTRGVLLDRIATSRRWRGSPDLIRYLVERGAFGEDLRVPAYGDLLPHVARHADVASWLLDRGADIHGETDHGINALHAAIKTNAVDSVRVLLDRGADPNRRTRDGVHPLQLAAERIEGDTDPRMVFELLLAAGADPELASERGQRLQSVLDEVDEAWGPLHRSKGGPEGR